MTTKVNKIMLKGGELTTVIAAGSATLETTDYNIFKTAITGGGDTLTLPVAGLKVGAVYKIYDTGGTAGTDNITIDPTGATTINGAATVAISSNYGFVTCIWDGTQWIAEISTGGGGGGVTDHGLLNAASLLDDDHTQYLLADGTRTLSGNLTVTGTVDGRDVAADGSTLDALEAGIGYADFDTDVSDTLAFAIGAALDTPAITITESAGTVYLNVEKSGTGAIRFVFSDGVYTLDCTPIQQVALTAGTDTIPTLNYIYVLQSTKTLTTSTVGWSAAEHAPIATVLVQSAASVATDGAYKVHAWTDHTKKTTNNGHLACLNYWIRQQPATWSEGMAVTETAGAGVLDISVSSGSALQLHPYTFPARNTATGDSIYIANGFTVPFEEKGDLTGIVEDSLGGTLGSGTTDFYNLVIWAAVNETEADCKLFCNVPSSGYGNNNSDRAINDDKRTADYSIPASFRGVGVLLARLTVQISGGIYSVLQNEDLRGTYPNTSAGASGGGGSVFLDNAFRVQDQADISKEIALEASSITTGTTRTLTMADADVDLAKLVGIEAGADVTDATNVNAAGAVMESDFTPSHGLLAQQSGTGSPTMVSLGTNEILGRLSSGGSNIEGLTASDVRTLINVEDGADVTDTANVVSALSGATVTGAITFSSSVAFALDTLTPAASVNVDWTTGNMQTLTVNQATTITFTNPSGPANLVLKLIQDATGSRVFTLPTLGWGDGITPRWSTGANDVDMLFLFFDGTNYHASAMINSEQV